MIKQEEIQINGRTLRRTYSDSGKYIIQEQTGNKYEEAVDVVLTYTYIESEEDLPAREKPEQGLEQQETEQQKIEQQEGE